MNPEPSTSNSPAGKSVTGIKIPELLAPAGSFEKMVTAIHYGADAVYCGGKQYSLRAHAANFSEEEMQKAVEFAHTKNVKVYVTVNILAHQEDLLSLEKYLRYLQDIEVDGVIISDPGILMLARETIPEVPIHLSTQANVTNRGSAKFWEAQGVARLNLARELSLPEITAIRTWLGPATQVELFVHGALCIAYSGKCLLSYYFTGRDANRGECAQPCRYKYVLQEEKRPDQYFPMDEDEHGTYIFNSRDLCLLNRLPQLINAGVDSLKIEGRMKSVYYVGAVVRVYRAALDYLAGRSAGELASERRNKLPPVYMDELMKVGTRGYTENFIFGPPGPDGMLYDRPRTGQEHVPVGMVKDFGSREQGENWLEIDVRNPLRRGEMIEYLSRDIKAVPVLVTGLQDPDGLPLEQANPGNVVKIQYGRETVADWQVNGLLRRKQ